ncbi:MAG: DnaJ domain-containing protein [Gammaproteobacteria bacterium]|nr:DnaJ domain-containing protein [Gammaproteobacteria bacterium]MCP5138033.1 DnaJ domain-containing protein [Gammaproteobacteria bacterium]
MDFSLFIFLAVVMLAFGYIAGNARSFNVWKLLLIGAVLAALTAGFNLDKTHIATMLGAFLVGYLLPYGHLLEGFGDAVSDAINAIRYRDTYDEIRRKEAEVDELRRRYEQDQRQANEEQRDRARDKRREDARSYRAKRQRANEGQSSHNSAGAHTALPPPPPMSTKAKYLQTLGLDPAKDYSYGEIKRAYRRQASKFHPDKHQHRGTNVVREMGERFKAVKEAYEWIATHLA